MTACASPGGRAQVPIRRLTAPVAPWNPRSAPETTFRYVDIAAIDRRTKTLLAVPTLRITAAPARARQILRTDDVLISTVRPNLNAVARVPPEYDGAIGSTGFCVLRAIRDRLDARYLLHWVRSNSFVAEMTRRATGANYPAVSDAVVKDSQIPLPSLAEQRRIADLLDRADAVLRKREAVVTVADDLAMAAFDEAFGEPTVRRQHWRSTELGDLLVFLTSGSRGWAQHYADSGRPFLRVQNVGRNRLLLDDVAHVHPPHTTEARRTTVEPGDVLLSITADLGRTAVIPDNLGPAYINQHLALLRVRDVEPVFLSAFLASAAGQAQIRRLNRQGVKAGLNFDDVRSLQLPLPPLEEQRRFVELWERCETYRRRLLAGVKQAQALFDGTLQRVLAGAA